MSNAETTDLTELYSQRILRWASDIARIGRLEDPQASVTVVSPLCGSKVTVDLKMAGELVSDFAHEVKACALGQTSSSIMAAHVVGTSATELRALRERMLAMLKENGPPPEGKWSDLECLLPVRDYKGRHGSVMLTFDAVVRAIDEIEAKRGR